MILQEGKRVVALIDGNVGRKLIYVREQLRDKAKEKQLPQDTKARKDYFVDLTQRVLDKSGELEIQNICKQLGVPYLVGYPMNLNQAKNDKTKNMAKDTNFVPNEYGSRLSIPGGTQRKLHCGSVIVLNRQYIDASGKTSDNN